MAFSFLASETGRVHVCGHRGYSRCYPENTLPALQAAKDWGATTVEVDVVLTAEGEPIILHDLTVDRTTDGQGFAADLSLERIRSLDAGADSTRASRARKSRCLQRRSSGRSARTWDWSLRSRKPSARTLPSTAWRLSWKRRRQRSDAS